MRWYVMVWDCGEQYVTVLDGMKWQGVVGGWCEMVFDGMGWYIMVYDVMEWYMMVWDGI